MRMQYKYQFIKIYLRVFLIIFAVCGLSFMYKDNLEIQNIRANKLTATDQPKKIKYILQWTKKFFYPFGYMGQGISHFVKNKCEYTNCFVTDDPNYLNDLTSFDAVAFNGADVIKLWPSDFPTMRSPKQKYIFATQESPDRYPACNKSLDNFFNWTWTYKLNSDFRWGYITVYDMEGNVVGPAADVKWPKKMDPINDGLKAKLSTKSKAAAWFVSNCKTNAKREDFVAEVKTALAQYGHTVDIYGKCGELSCPKNDTKICFKKVEHDYYFYFSLENSFAEDYVTEKLLTALNNYAVPVVFGSANYSRFLPEGSYLNGRELGAKNLARVMNDLIANKTKYYEYFRWRNHFVYKSTSSNVDVCKLCEVLNNDQMVNTVSIWSNLRKWWNEDNVQEKCCKQRGIKRLENCKSIYEE